MTTLYIGIGSNLDEPLVQVRSAIEELQHLAECHVIAVSGLYQSRAMNPPEEPDLKQPNYINAVIKLATERDELDLLDDLQTMEQRHGRVRTEQRWEPRPLDLDILLADDKTINHPRLIVPHPGLHERSFVLYPLHEIAPDLMIPGHGSLKELIAHCDYEGLERLSDT